MVKVFSPGNWHGLMSRSFVACLTAMSVIVVLSAGWAVAQPQAPAKPATPAAPKQTGAPGAPAEPVKDKGDSAKAKEEVGADQPDAEDEKKAGEQAPAEVPPDPSQTLKNVNAEVFQDPNAEEILDVKKFAPIRSAAASRADIEAVKTMAGDPSYPVDETRIRRVVDGMAAMLTDTRNIQALIDPPPGTAPTSPTARAIQEATATLLEPVLTARSAKSTRFQAVYNRVLVQRLAPLLKHHLIPRIQAMIVLGQSGAPEAFRVYVDEIKNPQQTVWVKLWAMRGLTNTRLYSPGRLSASQEIEAARVIAGLLEKEKNLPWPVQLRGLETLATLRQGFVPTNPKEAEMAAAAMQLLDDPKARNEVRAEAAKALGFMQITPNVLGYNFGLIAYATSVLAASLGEQITANYSDKAALNQVKAEYLASMLVGPLYQAFDGQPGVRESGLLHTPAAASSRAEIQKMLDALKPMAKAAIELVRAPTGQIKARRQDLVARVAELKEFLAKNAPNNRHLVPGDDGFLQKGADQQADAPAAEPADDKVAGARGGK